jgi:hypothetical protein
MSQYVPGETAIQLLQSEKTGRLLPYIYFLLKLSAPAAMYLYLLDIVFLIHRRVPRDFLVRRPPGESYGAVKTKVNSTLHQSGLIDQENDFVRLQRQSFFMTFPIERLWFYLKVSRNMNKFDYNDFTIHIADLALEGKEGKYTKCKL